MDSTATDLPEPVAIDVIEEHRVPARLLEFRPGAFVALPAHTTMALVEAPQAIAVPGAPAYCLGLVRWHDRWIPLLDLDVLLAGSAQGSPNLPAHALVIAYQAAPGAPLEYGALCAPRLVKMVEVGDSQRCELPDDCELWGRVAVSCFDEGGRPVPVLDTARLLAQPHPGVSAAPGTPPAC